MIALLASSPKNTVTLTRQRVVEVADPYKPLNEASKYILLRKPSSRPTQLVSTTAARLLKV